VVKAKTCTSGRQKGTRASEVDREAHIAYRLEQLSLLVATDGEADRDCQPTGQESWLVLTNAMVQIYLLSYVVSANVDGSCTDPAWIDSARFLTEKPIRNLAKSMVASLFEPFRSLETSTIRSFHRGFCSPVNSSPLANEHTKLRDLQASQAGGCPAHFLLPFLQCKHGVMPRFRPDFRRELVVFLGPTTLSVLSSVSLFGGIFEASSHSLSLVCLYDDGVVFPLAAV
jgi:hypothetical protein